MNYVGIDIAKQTHYCSILSAHGEVLVSPFPFSNDYDGFNLLLSKLKPFSASSLTIGMESTAHYGENLIQFLFNREYKICMINPLQIAALRKNNIRKTKTDKIDTFIIAKALMLNVYKCVSGRDIEILTLKHLCRSRKDLIKSRTRLKIQLVSYIDQIFPEFQYFFSSGIHIQSSYSLLKEHSSPDEIANLHLTYLTNLLKRASHGRFGKDEAIGLKKLAARSVGNSNKILCIRISQCIASIELLSEQINVIETYISDTMNSVDSVLMTIPGIGQINGAMILGEIGDCNRFSSPAKLRAFAGLDPSVNQSGKFKAGSTKMSKRGSRILRNGLMNAAFNVVRNSETFANYYDAKRAQGKTHYNALGHVAGKLIRVIHKMLTNDIAFDLD